MQDYKETVSVITVAKNAEMSIENAIVSVIGQTYNYIEYIFVVGNSSDNTDKIIDNYKDKMHERGIKYKHISEPDKGIYDAMNKGLAMASGNWIYFLNADDKLCDEFVFERVFNASTIDYDKVDCIYGNIILLRNGKLVERKGAPINTIYYRYPFSHQAAFAKRKTILQYGFNEKYRRLADFNQFFRMYLDKKKFEYIDIDIAYFCLEGVSQKNNIELMFERESIHKELGVAQRKRLRRWIRYFFICVIKDNDHLYNTFIGINEWLQNNRYIL